MVTFLTLDLTYFPMTKDAAIPNDITSYTILPTTGCNARCYYCFEHGSKVMTMTRETAGEVVRFITEHCGPKKTVAIMWFGGEPTSLFLTNNPGNRQVSALTGEPLAAACFNTPAFRDYFYRIVEKLAEYVPCDGFFYDEPHYQLPKGIASITGGVADDWSCRCPICQKKFEQQFGYPMPKLLTPEVVQFRENEALQIVRESAARFKAIRPDAKMICCVHATQNTYYVTERRGYDNWDKVGRAPEIDVFSTTIINYSLPQSFFVNITRRTVDIAKKYGKGNQRWLMGYFNEPENLDRVKEVCHLYDEMGVESLFAWTYRGGHGTVLAAPHALQLWDKLGEAYGEVLDPKYKIK